MPGLGGGGWVTTAGLKSVEDSTSWSGPQSALFSSEDRTMGGSCREAHFSLKGRPCQKSLLSHETVSGGLQKAFKGETGCGV